MTEGAREQSREVDGTSARVAAWLAWPLCLLCVALAAACLIFSLLNGRTLGEIFLTGTGPTIGALATLIVSFSVVGALIASNRPENPIGWIFLADGFFYGLLSVGDEYAIYALLTNPGALPLGAEASWLGQWVWAPGLALILVFLPLLFPDGHPPSPRWRPVGWVGGLSIGLTVVSSTILLWPERGQALLTGNDRPSHVLQVLVDFMAVPMLFVAGLGAVISLFVRFRRARGDEQQQIKWFASATALTLVWILVFGQSTLRGLPGAIVALSALLVIPSIPIATGIAILRYRLYDIDRIINRTLVYASLTAILVGVYFGGVTATQALFRTITGQEQSPQLVVVASTLVIAALFNPLRRRIQSFIDLSFYRSKYDAAKTLEGFSMKLRTLYFNSDRTANGFLDLSAAFDEATEPQINDVMEQGILRYAGEGTIHDFVNSMNKRAISMLWRSGRLTDIQIPQIKDYAEEYGIQVRTDGSGAEERILVPETNKGFKQLLDLLNQNYFPGIFDGAHYVANSKRPF